MFLNQNSKSGFSPTSLLPQESSTSDIHSGDTVEGNHSSVSEEEYEESGEDEMKVIDEFETHTLSNLDTTKAKTSVTATTISVDNLIHSHGTVFEDVHDENNLESTTHSFTR